MSTLPATILIVDDEAQNRRLLEALLRPEGYLTFSAASGTEALESIAWRRPDLILLDIMMPGMDGYQVASLLKAKPATSSIPIIMVTALTDRDSRLAGLKAGAEEFLTKPVDRAELWLRVRNLLRLKALGDLMQKHSDSLQQQVQAGTVDLQRFRMAMDATGDAITLVSRASMRFIEFNATACTMLGYTRRELFELGPAQIGAGTPQELDATYADMVADAAGRLKETRVQRKDGSWLDVEIQMHAHQADADWFIVGVLRDITERKQAQRKILDLNLELEDRVRQRTAQLQVANRELEAFSYSVSHDLRTPLSAIDGFSAVLAEEIGAGAVSERGKHYLARIRAGVVHMGDLIDALLLLAQVSRTNLDLGDGDLSAMAEAVLDGYREREPDRVVQAEIQPGLVARGDTRLLQQVLDNLLGNAWKFSAREPNARITLTREAGVGGTSVYAVRDNGAGFDMAYSDKLFGAFQRLHSVSEFPGTGIGLATVQKIITRHGGRVWAESTPGQGATFYFTLDGASA